MKNTRISIIIAGCACAILFTGCSDYPTDPDSHYKNKEVPANNPPVIQAQPDVSANIGETLTLRAVATDPDGDAITYELISYIRGLYDVYPDVEMGLHNGIFQFRPRAADLPDRRFAFIARDAHGAKAETEFVVSVTDIEPGGRVEIYADEQMADCSVADTEPGIVYLYLFHNRINDVKVIQFYAPIPACWNDATWLGDNIVKTHTGSTQDSQNGLAVFHDNCAGSTVYLGYIAVFSQGTGTECCRFEVLPADAAGLQSIQAMDCEYNPLKGEGKGAIINGNETCPCDSQARTTWEQIKVLFNVTTSI